jgi:hypothetical protein
MESIEIIEHQQKRTFNLWTFSGDKIKKLWNQYMETVDTLYSLDFLVQVLLFTVEEYSFFTLEGEMYQDQELADLALQFEKEEKEELRAKVKSVSNDQIKCISKLLSSIRLLMLHQLRTDSMKPLPVQYPTLKT